MILKDAFFNKYSHFLITRHLKRFSLNMLKLYFDIKRGIHVVDVRARGNLGFKNNPEVSPMGVARLTCVVTTTRLQGKWTMVIVSFVYDLSLKYLKV